MNEDKSNIDSNIYETDVIKDSLENLYLYLNEIDKIINSDKLNKDIASKHYKLQQLEKYLSEMNNMFEYLQDGIHIDRNKIS